MDPAPSTTATIASTDSSLHRRADGYAAPTAEDRHEARVLAEAHALGYRLAVRCTRCSQWLVSEASVAAHMGPYCRQVVAE